MGKKKKTKGRRNQNRAPDKGTEGLPAASLASRSVRPVVTVAAPGASYYLDLADVALGRKPALPLNKKGDR